MVETDTFGAFAIVLAEYGIADAATRSAVSRPASPGGGRRLLEPDGRRFVAGSVGPGTKLPSLGQIGFAELRDAYEVQATACSRAASTCFIIETQ